MYALHGAFPGMFFFWTASIVSAGNGFFLVSRHRLVVDSSLRADLFIIVGIFCMLLPLYSYNVAAIPHQINTDEVTTTNAIRAYTQSGADPFGLSDYFFFPSATFVLFGRLISFTGDITLYNVRFLHALFGIAAVLAAYPLFRALFAERFYAAAATLLLGFSHALVAISRMAMWNNIPVLIAAATLSFLAFGLRKRHLGLVFCAGICSGLGWYSYYAGRFIIVLCGLWIVVSLYFALRDKTSWRWVLSAGAALCTGFVLAAAPIAVATIQNTEDSGRYIREQLLIFSEGRALQQRWVHQETEQEAVLQNITQGLSAFNAPIVDNGYIYPNFGHGFVDPITGLLLWIGAGAVLVWYRRDAFKISMLASFVFLYLFFAFLTTKAPSYTRYLITLPLVAYLSIEGIRAYAGGASHFLPRRFGAPVTRNIAVAAVALIAVVNMNIFGKFVMTGMDNGNDVGSTARYIAAHEHEQVYVVADESHPYYSWGKAGQWQLWAAALTPESDRVAVISYPEAIRKRDGILLLRAQTWDLLQQAISSVPFTVTPITPNGAYVAVRLGRE